MVNSSLPGALIIIIHIYPHFVSLLAERGIVESEIYAHLSRMWKSVSASVQRVCEAPIHSLKRTHMAARNFTRYLSSHAHAIDCIVEANKILICH